MVQRAVNYLFGFYEKYLIPCAHIFNQTARRIDCNSLHIQFGTFSCILVVVPSLSLVWLFATLWTVAHQVSLSFIISRNLFKLMSMEAVMPSNHLVLCRPLLLPAVFPNIRFFSNESVLHIRYQSIGASALVLPMNIQGFFRIDWFDLLAVQGTLKSLLQHLKSSTIWKHQFLGSQPSLWSNSPIHSWLWKRNSFDLCQQSDVSAF